MPTERDTAFQMAASNIRFGRGITREIGMDLVIVRVIKVIQDVIEMIEMI